MGNTLTFVKTILGYGPEQVDFDELTKEELIEHIKKTKTIKLDIFDETYENAMREVELQTEGLMPMECELYEQLSAKLQPLDYKKHKVTFKKRSWVKPKFGPEKVKEETVTTPKKEFNDMDPAELVSNSMAQPVAQPVQTKLEVVVNAPESPFNMGPITLEEFNAAFKDDNYSTDLMGISKKMLRDCSQFTKHKMINKFNEVLTDNSEISEHSFGRAYFAYKASKKGAPEDVKSFRMVTSIPSIVNHFHRILALRLNNYILQNKYIDTTIQKGGISGIKMPLLEQILKVKNTIKVAQKNKTEACMAFVDVSNAFPSMRISNICESLKQYGVSPKLIDYINSYYSNFAYYIDAREWATEIRKWNKGLLQGCPLSPLLFVLTMNRILKHLETKYKERCGIEIEGVGKVLFLAYIDDICIMCKDAESMVEVFTDLEKLLKEAGMDVNKDKTNYVHINPTKAAVTDIALVDKYKYLGEVIYADGNSENSYWSLLFKVKGKLKWLDGNKMTNEQKCSYVSKVVIPLIQKKFTVLYDVGVEHKKKLLKILNIYLTKWGESDSNKQIQLTANFKELLKDTGDNVLKDLDITDDLYDLTEDKEKTNVLLKNVKFEYDDDDETALDEDDYDDVADSDYLSDEE
jgi:hypothetical protein